MCQYDPGYLEYNPLVLQEKDPWTGKEWRGDPREEYIKRRIANNWYDLERILGMKINPRFAEKLAEKIVEALQ